MRWLLGILGVGASTLLRTRVPASAERSGDPPATGGFLTATKLSFEETVAQMHRGYENTQRVVQAMDTKAGAVVALSLAIFAFTGSLVAWIHDKLGDGILQNTSAPHCRVGWTVVALVVLSGLFGFACLDRSFSTVRPNGLPDPKHFTTLFPVTEDAWKNPEALAHLRRIVEGESREFVLNEFQQQLLAMGAIVFRKIKCLRQAIGFLWWQGLFATILAVTIGAAAGFGIIGAERGSKSSPGTQAAPSSKDPMPVATP